MWNPTAGEGTLYLISGGFVLTKLMLAGLVVAAAHILALGSALVGLAYGAFWSLFPCIISEVFGLRQFAAIYKSVV
jgi:hypothetical protein